MGKLLGLICVFFGVFFMVRYHADRWIDWFRFQSIGTRDYVVEKLAQMYIEVSPNRALAYMLGSSFAVFTLVVLMSLPNIALGLSLGLIAGVIVWKLPKPIVNWMSRRRIDKFVNQMVDGLAMMANAMKSGLSVPQAIGLVTEEMPDPIRKEFNIVLSENKLGVSLEEALTNLSKRIPSDDVEMFVTAVNILKETGGNLAETFDTITSTIRERIKIENKIKALTAQGFYQGIVVAAVPPGLFLMFYTSDPEFMRPLFTTFFGWVILTVILSLEVVGFYVILRIIKIEV